MDQWLDNTINYSKPNTYLKGPVKFVHVNNNSSKQSL